MAIPSSILVCVIARMEELGVLQSMGCKKMKHNLVTTKQQEHWLKSDHESKIENMPFVLFLSQLIFYHISNMA